MRYTKIYYLFYSVVTILIGILCAMTLLAASQWGSRHISHDVDVYPSSSVNIDTNKEALTEEGASPTADILPLENSQSTSAISVTSVIPTKKLPPITATQYLVETLAGTTIINQKDANRSVPIASLTKLVTAVVAQNLLDGQTTINIGPKVLSTYYGNTAKLSNGEQLTAADLMYPLLMTSSNDAAQALALAYGQKAFVKAMNDWVYSIGAYHTYFAEPTGLSPQNISSAGDLFLILNWIYKNRPDILAITLTKVKSVGFHDWVNPAHFLNLSSYLGGKDGYIPEAGLTSAALFDITVKGKRELVAVVVLGSSNRDLDVLGLLDRAGDGNSVSTLSAAK